MQPPRTPEQNELPPILVVDDERGYREGIARVMSSVGYRVTTASDGEQALQELHRATYPIVLVDLKMPKMDGFELLERIRIEFPETLCIVVSAFATIESAVQTTKKGAFDFVVKPFVPDDLRQVVANAVATWQLAQDAARLRAEREAHLLELAEEKGRNRTILQALADGLIVVNISGDVVLDNPAARALLGCRGGSSLQGPLPVCMQATPIMDEVRRLLHDPGVEQASRLEMTIDAAELEPRVLRATIAPVRGPDATTLGVVILLTDISQAKAIDKMKTAFVSMVAHELKAPIAAVEGYLSLISEGGLDADVPRIKTIAERCLQRTGALLALIQDLLEVTRRDAGHVQRRIEPVNMDGLIQSLVDFHANEAVRKGVSVQIEIGEQVQSVMADRGDMERLLTNLLSNAIKYNRPDGSVTVRLRQDGQFVCLEVQDTGIGMSDSDRRHVGEEFFRAKNEATRGIPGTGLGMAVVKRLVSDHKGVMEVESSPGVGTTFRVHLPAAN